MIKLGWSPSYSLNTAEKHTNSLDNNIDLKLDLKLSKDIFSKL